MRPNVKFFNSNFQDNERLYDIITAQTQVVKIFNGFTFVTIELKSDSRPIVINF